MSPAVEPTDKSIKSSTKEPPRDCEVCGYGSPSLRFEVSGYDYFRCRGCAHLFVWPKPSTEDLLSYYSDPAFYDDAEALEGRLRRDYRRRLAVLASLAARLGLEKRLLDVGCASGHFLDEASRDGWDVIGQDISVALAERGREKYGLEIHAGSLDRLDVRGGLPFVTGWEVIEHAPHPGGFLRSMTRLLRPGGILALSTPMSDGLPARILGGKFPMLCPPQHLCLFSRRSMRILAARAGLSPEHFETFSNIGADSIRSGLVRLCGYEKGDSVPGAVAAIAGAMGKMLSFLPPAVDRMGLGSEMFVAFRHSGAD